MTNCSSVLLAPAGSLEQSASNVALCALLAGLLVVVFFLAEIKRRTTAAAPQYLALEDTTGGEGTDGYNSGFDEMALIEDPTPSLTHSYRMHVGYSAFLGTYAGCMMILLILVLMPASMTLRVFQIIFFNLTLAFDVYLLAYLFSKQWRQVKTYFICGTVAFVILAVFLTIGLTVGHETLHCSLCPLYSFGRATGFVYLVMALLWVVALGFLLKGYMRKGGALFLWFQALKFGSLSIGGFLSLGGSGGGSCVLGAAMLFYVLGEPGVLLHLALSDSTALMIKKKLPSDNANLINSYSTKFRRSRKKLAQKRGNKAEKKQKEDLWASPEKKKKKKKKKKVNPIVLMIREGLEEHVPIFQIDEVEKFNRVGRGGFGEVFRGRLNGSEVAIKRVFHLDMKKARVFLREVNMMARLSHPNVVRLVGVVVDPSDSFLLTEFVERGSLFDIIHKDSSSSPRPFPVARARKVLLGTASGMAYLHAMTPPFLHRDLKSQNLLIGDHWSVKICDFGMCRKQALAVTMTKLGTLQWVAPEVLREERYSEKADVYSFAIVVWELLSGRVPYVGRNSIEVANKVAYKGLRPVVPGGADPFLSSLMIRCWNDLPAIRPSFQQIKEELQEEEGKGKEEEEEDEETLLDKYKRRKKEKKKKKKKKKKEEKEKEEEGEEEGESAYHKGKDSKQKLLDSFKDERKKKKKGNNEEDKTLEELYKEKRKHKKKDETAEQQEKDLERSGMSLEDGGEWDITGKKDGDIN